MTLWQTIHVLKNSYLFFIYFLKKWTINNNFCQVEQCVVPHFDVHLYRSKFLFSAYGIILVQIFLMLFNYFFTKHISIIDFVNFICFKSRLGFVLKSLHSFQLLLRRPKRWRHYNNSTFKIVTKLAIKYLKVLLQPTHFMSK